MTQNRPCTRLERPVHMANPPSRNTRDMPICIVHHHNVISTSVAKRAVAQLGSALRSGRRGRGFKSRQPDNWTGLLRNQQSGFSFPVPTIKPSDRTAVNNPPHTATNHITAYRNFCGALDWFSLSVGGVGVSRGGVEFVPVDAGPVCGRDAVVRFGRRCLFALPQGVGDE